MCTDGLHRTRQDRTGHERTVAGQERAGHERTGEDSDMT